MIKSTMKKAGINYNPGNDDLDSLGGVGKRRRDISHPVPPLPDSEQLSPIKPVSVTAPPKQKKKPKKKATDAEDQPAKMKPNVVAHVETTKNSSTSSRSSGQSTENSFNPGGVQLPPPTPTVSTSHVVQQHAPQPAVTTSRVPQPPPGTVTHDRGFPNNPQPNSMRPVMDGPIVEDSSGDIAFVNRLGAAFAGNGGTSVERNSYDVAGATYGASAGHSTYSSSAQPSWINGSYDVVSYPRAAENGHYSYSASNGPTPNNFQQHQGHHYGSGVHPPQPPQLGTNGFSLYDMDKQPGMHGITGTPTAVKPATSSNPLRRLEDFDVDKVLFGSKPLPRKRILEELYVRG